MEEEQVSKSNCGEEERVCEWETGLPTGTDLTPLSQYLISPELASAFSITAEPFQTMLDVNRASQSTLSNIRRSNSGISSSNYKALSSFMEDRCLDPEPIVVDEEEPDLGEKRKLEDGDVNDDGSAKNSKRQRLAWTPQLHKRFVDVVGHLGIDNAVPKTIMQLMNVEGLTRENVASHLQKYRLYLKRMNEGAPSNDPLFASTPVPPSLRDSNRSRTMPLPPVPHPVQPMAMQPMPVPVPVPVPVPMVGVSHGQAGYMAVGNSASGSYNGFEFHPYGMFREHQQGQWSGNRFGSVVPHSHVSHNDK